MMLILSMLSLLTNAKLQLFLDGSLKDVNYSLGNFGHIPYGRTLSGMIAIPYEIVNMEYDLCNLSNINVKFDIELWVLARNGNCSATTKAYVAQQLNAKMLIIISDRTNVTSKVEMNNDGMGFRVHIPTVLIGKKDGEALIQEFQTLMDAQPYGIISFNDSKRVEKPSVILFNTLYDLDGFKFLREFKQYYEKLKDYAQFSITYDIIVSKADKRINFTKENSDCMGGGRYCIDLWTTEGNGRQVVEEQLRQHCIFLENPSLWFDYMDYFFKNCDKVNNYEDCYKENTIVDQDKINDCVVRSYSQENKKKELKQNDIMDQWAGNKSYSGLIYYPGILVNNNPYKGNLDAYSVTEDICSNMLDGMICTQILNDDENNNQTSNNVNWAMISFAIVSCILFGLFLFLCYRRRLKQQMQQELGQQVNEMVSQYIKFYETKNEGA